MAITIEASPAATTPVYNEINYVCSSTNVAQPGFKYLVDIYLNAVKIARRRVSAEPNNNKLIVDVGTICENYITNSDGVYPNEAAGQTTGAEQCKDFIVKFGEEYEVATVRTQYPDLTVGASFRVWNAAYNYEEWVGFTAPTTGLLTNKPTYTSGYYGAGFSTVILASGATFTSSTIKTYLASVLQNTYVIPLHIAPVTAYNLPTGYDSINLIANLLITGTPVQPILTAAIDRYDYFVTTSVGSSTPITVNLVDRCEEQESDRLHFLNHYGGFDTFDFTLLGTKKASISKKSMRRSPERLTSAGALITSTLDKGLTNYNSTFERVDKLSSNWITEVESDWLIDLLASPTVILERNGVFTSIIVEDTAYDFKTEQSDQLFKIDVTIKHSLKEVRQRG